MNSDGSHCTEPTDQSRRFRKPQVTFLVTLFSTTLIVCSKVNFTNLSRYSELNEKTYRRHFEKAFEFLPCNIDRMDSFPVKIVRTIGKYLEITYHKVVDTVIDRERCHTIGLISGEDDWEYPLWVLFNEKTSDNFRLKHVGIKNESAKLEPEFPDSELCAIVSTKRHLWSIH